MSLVIYDDKKAHIVQDTLLLEAVEDGDEATVRNLVSKERASLTTTNPDGNTPLHVATIHGNRKIAQFLLEDGADIEAYAKNGDTPLYCAVASDNLDMIELLLLHGARIDSANGENSKTALFKAVWDRNLPLIRVLLERGADIDRKLPDGQTPLSVAVVQGDLKVVDLLLQFGANLTSRVPDGRTVEEYASNNAEMIDLLRAPHILEGPSIKTANTSSEFRFTHIPAPPPKTGEHTDELNACHAFQATIIDFYLGEQEQRVQKSSSIYDIIYGNGPEMIMSTAKTSLTVGEKPAYRWYHFPANNVHATFSDLDIHC
jgi:hypothetical protein